MLREVARYLPQFESAVLTGFDGENRPYSIRCHAELDGASGVIRLSLPALSELLPGPACLLCHRHDEQFWNMLSFVVRGRLEPGAGGWQLRPAQFIPGVGIGGVRAYLRFLVQGRRTTSRYLKKRGLARPAVPWEEWQEVLGQTASSSTP